MPEFVHVFDDVLERQDLLFFDPVLERGIAPVGDRYRQIDPSLRAAENLAIRGSIGTLTAVERDPVLRSELRGRRVVVIAPDEGNASLEPKVQFPAWARTTGWPFEPHVLRDLELRAIVTRTGALLNDPNDHYQLRTGWHADQFLRVGDAVNDPVDVSRIAEWIDPYVDGRSVLLADTGTLLPILFRIQANRLSRARMTVAVEALQEYPADAALLARVVTGVHTISPGGVLFIVSADATRRLVRLFKGMSLDDDQVIALFDTTTGPVPQVEVHSFCRLPIERWKPDDNNQCDACAERRLVHIDATSYRPEIDIEWKVASFSPELIQEHEVFWTSVDRTNALSLHVDVSHDEGQHERVRHFPVFLNIIYLLGDTEFRRGCIDRLRSIGTPDLILIPQHPATATLQLLTEEAFGAGIEVYAVPPGRFSSELVNAIGLASHILIADDALVTSRTAMGLRDEIYRATQAVESDPRVDFFAAVGRPDAKQTLVNVGRRYRQDRKANRVHFGEQVLLPRIARRNCPWCQEREILSRLLPKLSGRSAALAQERIKHLEWGTGCPGIGLYPSQGTTVGSFFGNLRPQTAFAAAASAALSVTLTGASRERVHIVAPTDLFISAYRDAAILAGFLRTLKATELRFPGREAVITAAIEQLDGPRLSPSVACEIAWAALTNKVPYSPVLALMERAQVQEELRALFRDLFRLNYLSDA